MDLLAAQEVDGPDQKPRLGLTIQLGTVVRPQESPTLGILERDPGEC